ncbi:MAG: hypothetical protein OXG62_09285 [Nitrospinae bacterium]|nr:hypothetical protein [Nitrospinota bacterium]
MPVPAMFRAVPPGGLALTVNALPAGAELLSSASSNVTFSVVAFTDALENTGALLSGTSSPRTAIFRASLSMDPVHEPVLSYSR